MNEILKKFGCIFIILLPAFLSEAQQTNCIFRESQFTIHFGTDIVSDPNSGTLNGYRRVSNSCPSDGYYSFASHTSECFGDDWHTLPEDHTAGDVNGNMLLVNAARNGGAFLRIPVSGLKSNTIYEIGFWLINLCKPTKKCPFLLLPELNIRLETPEGRIVANIGTGPLPRISEPKWTRHAALFTTPASTSNLMLVMIDNVPSGCGNDFALDDIAFRECLKKDTQFIAAPKSKPPAKQSATSKPPAKKVFTTPQKKDQAAKLVKPKTDTISKTISVVKQTQKITTPAPLVLKNRQNALVKMIETAEGEIKIEIYDNGEIDGDTVSIYHNNELIRSKQRLSQKPISFAIKIDPSKSHHEIIMVAENLGSIPPNTSVMIIKTENQRHEIFISSTEQKNAKVVFDLKKY